MLKYNQFDQIREISCFWLYLILDWKSATSHGKIVIIVYFNSNPYTVVEEYSRVHFVYSVVSMIFQLQFIERNKMKKIPV